MAHNLHVGQIWRPTRGRALPKVIVELTADGGVSTVTEPRILNAPASYLSGAGWAKWVEKYGAVADE